MAATFQRGFPRLVVAVASFSLIPVTTAFAAPPSVGVAVLRAAPWSPGDSAREGAGEFEVLLRVAQLQRAHRVSGVISIGDRNGMRPCGGENALTQAALTGVPVVKLARGGEVAATPDDLFIDAGPLGEEGATRILAHCLRRYGAPPAAADPANPTKRERAKIRDHLQPFREAFALAAAPRVARK